MTVKDIYITDYTIHNLKVKKLSKKRFFQTISIITATALFLPFIIMGGGVFYYYGDFNVQEIPFYQLVHDAVRNGDTGWMHNVDLGTDMLSSFSFYLLGSPFFWLTIPFPSEAVPYLIGPLLILKDMRLTEILLLSADCCMHFRDFQSTMCSFSTFMNR